MSAGSGSAPYAGDEQDPFRVRLLYAPHDPTPRQHAFYLLDELGVLEALYGGAAGGGKSDALLTSALRYVDVPGYAAILFRKTFADLSLPGALIPRSREWLSGTDARWNERDYRWTFPSGATLSFGYLQTSADRYRYASAEFQFVGFDELTHFGEEDYRFLFTRLRRPSEGEGADELARVPLRMRGASNPGSRGHEWVKRRLVKRLPKPVRDGEEPDPMDTPERAAKRVYVPARLKDNPHVDQDAYTESLANVDPYTRAQMLNGDWEARPPGEWVYDHLGIAAAEALGAELDEELARGTIAPPAGDLLRIGIDWGNYTGAVILWPLAGGGLYVPAAGQFTGDEPGEAFARIVGGPLDELEPRGERVIGLLGTVHELASRPRPARLPPALDPREDPIRLVETHAYDAAGKSSMDTYLKRARRRHPRARSTRVSFGAPAPDTGRVQRKASYKGESMQYVRGLLRRAAAGRDTRILAVSPKRAAPLLEQLRGMEWLDFEAGLVKKGDDHVHDALVAGVAESAIEHR